MQTLEVVDESGPVRTRRTFLPFAIAAVALALGSAPYVLGYALTPRGGRFIGQIFIIDDYCVYLSWARQAADGHFFARNLFTTDPQSGLEFNLFFLIIGAISHISHMSVIDVLQEARFLAAAALFSSIYRLYSLCLPSDRTTRCSAFAIALLGSGLAWIHLLKEQDVRLIYPSADSNQPEALLFSTAYFAPLAAISTAIICETMRSLIVMTIKREVRFAVIAGIFLLILGNIHTYDIIHVAAVWTVALIVLFISKRCFEIQLVLLSLVAGLVALPSTAYQYYLLRHEPVFYERAMETYTRTPNVTSYVFGYGFVLLLAILGLRAVIQKSFPLARSIHEGIRKTGGTTIPRLQCKLFALDSSVSRSLDPRLLIMITWAVVPFILIYAVHLPFQRKLIMGEDIPLSFLAGIGAVWLAGRLTQPRRRVVLAGIILSTIPSTLLFVGRDIATVRRTTALSGSTASPYLTSGELSTLSWISTHTQANDGIVAPIRMSLLIPGFCDRYVWAAHWSETPQCAHKFGELSAACSATASESTRRALFASTSARYFCYPNDPNHPSLGEMTPVGKTRTYADFAAHPPSFLRPVYHNSEYTVFAVSLQ